MDSSSLTPQDVTSLIDHLLKSKDPATVGLRKILKTKRDEASDFPLHPHTYEELHVPGRSKEMFTVDEKHVLELEKQVKVLELQLVEEKKKAVESSRAAYIKGKADGMAVGEQKGKDAAQKIFDVKVDDIQKKMHQFIADVDASKKRIYTDSHSLLLKLCFEFTKKIIGVECSTNAEVVLAAIKKSLSYIADRERIVIRVGKDDLETVSGRTDFWLPVGERAETIRIESDDRIEKGGCIVESNSGIVDARLGVQIEELSVFVEKIWESVVAAPLPTDK
jgi:flagellar biosynthesis/type III secretory pathway protein FliH